jgi:tight adherence protein B
LNLPMSPALLIAIAFVASGSFALAVGLVVREFVWAARGAQGSRTTVRRRARDIYDAAPPDTLVARFDQGFDRLIVESGSDWVPTTVFLGMVALSLAGGGGAWLATDEPLMGIAAALAGLLLPLATFAVLRLRRRAALREQLPHVVDLLARATRAGRSLEQAMGLVAQEAGGVLGPEFQRCEQQLQIGRSFEKAVKSLAGRVSLIEMQILATTLIVQRQAGGPLSETLDRMVTVIRDRLSAQRQVRAATAAGRLSTIVVASIAPLALVCLFAFQRDHLRSLFDDPLGRSMLMVALVLEIVGLAWVLWLLRAEE